MLFVVLVPAAAASAHLRGCRTHACDRRVERFLAAWREAHLPGATSFDLCVANKETGEPGSLERRFINPAAQGVTYGGAFQEEASKWQAGGGLRFAAHPWEASWRQQVAVFHQHGRQGEWTYGNWPTIHGCEGYEP